MSNDNRCVKSVHDDWGMGFHRCPRIAKVEHNGRGYCRQHDPEAVKARDIERDKQYDEMRKGRKTIANIERLRISITRAAYVVRQHSAELSALYDELLMIGWQPPNGENENEQR